MIFEYIKKFIFPSRCVICDKVLSFGNNLESNYLCPNCKNSLEFIRKPTCVKCGAMIDETDGTLCSRCKNNKELEYEYGFGLLRYNDSLKESLHRIKYNGKKEYLEFYGKCIAKSYKNLFKEINADYLVPVPIHKKRFKERNYNQASVLSHSISKELCKYGISIPVNEYLIFRTKNTKVLNKLDGIDRGKELNDAFKIRDLSNIEKIILVDDIYTTGTTINTIASLLKLSGVKKVYFVSIAIVDNL